MPPVTADRLRAALLAAVLLVQGLDALPHPRELTTQERRSSAVITEVDRWVPIAAVLGLAQDREGLMDQINRVVGAWDAVISVVLAPTDLLRTWTGTGQDWALFAFPDAAPRGIRISGHRRGAWIPLYIPWDDEHDFLREQITFRRFRGLLDGQSRRPNSTWNHFAVWASDAAFERWPDLDATRVWLVEEPVVLPGEPAAARSDWYLRHRARPKTANP